MATVAQEHDAPRFDNLPIDTELIADSSDAALQMELGTSTRETIDARTTDIVGHLNLLLGEELGSDEDPTIRELYRKGYKLLEMSTRPAPETPTVNAFFFMREVAGLTRHLLWVYAERRGSGVS